MLFSSFFVMAENVTKGRAGLRAWASAAATWFVLVQFLEAHSILGQKYGVSDLNSMPKLMCFAGRQL